MARALIELGAELQQQGANGAAIVNIGLEIANQATAREAPRALKIATRWLQGRRSMSRVRAGRVRAEKSR